MVTGLLLGVLLAAAGDAAPEVLSLQVETVRITPQRPGGNKDWVIPAEKKKSDNGGMCNLVAMGTAASEVGLMFSGAVKSLCTEATAEPGAAAQARLETSPDLYIRLTGGGKQTLRSYTVARTLSNNFKWRSVIPVAAIPARGLLLEVVSDDGSEDGEVIGQSRLPPEKLLEAAKSGALITMVDAGVEKLELVVEAADTTVRKKSQTFDVHSGSQVLEKFTVAAGEVVEVQARGEYKVSGRAEAVSVSGAVGAAARTFQDGPFKTGRPGAALVRVGKRRLITGALVTPCTSLVTPYEGVVFVGINNQDPNAVLGDLTFDVTVRPPTAAEWSSGNAADCKPAEVNDDSAELAVFAAKAITKLKANPSLATLIRKYTHPTGDKEVIRLIEQAPGSTKTSAKALITVVWKGGLLGGLHATVVGWEFNASRHIKAQVLMDDANVGISADNKKKLDAVFRDEVFASVK